MILHIKMTGLKLDTSILSVDARSDKAQVHNTGATSNLLMLLMLLMLLWGRLLFQASRGEFFCQSARTQ